MGLPVSHLCDRFTANVPAGQVQSRHTPHGGLISAAGSHQITPLPPRGAQVLHSKRMIIQGVIQYKPQTVSTVEMPSGDALCGC
jgi:hypothetical protein